MTKKQNITQKECTSDTYDKKYEEKDRPKKQIAKEGHSLCSVFNRCGGCRLLDIPYDEQLAMKQRFVEEFFSLLAVNKESEEPHSEASPSAVNQESKKMRPILGMKNPFYYRNKVVSPFVAGHKIADVSHANMQKNSGTKRATAKKKSTDRQKTVQREVLTGLYARGTHKLIPTDTCMLENETAKAVILAVRDLMMRWDISPYNEKTGTGFMRHVVVRVGHTRNEILVTLVTNAEKFPFAKSFCRELVGRVPYITSIVQNVNEQQTNVILGDHEHTLYGPGFILDTLCGLTFRISSQSFYQVNAAQAEVLYNVAVDLACLDGAKTVIDAYCGTGTIGLVAARQGAQRVIGVDNVASAVYDARENAKHNGITNAEFVVEDAEAFISNFSDYCDAASENLVVIMDPPRAGASETFMRAVVQLGSSRIVYISCNPKTQARDVAYLIQANYHIDTVQPVDMFPHTEHVECIVSLCR